MKGPSAFIKVAAAFLAGLPWLPQQADAAQHAQVTLITSNASVTSGSTTQAGLRFVLEPGWHIYWVNPGDSGQPPALSWRLPPGFSAGEIQWPRPERMQPTPHLADFGYHGEVLLPVTLSVPASAKAGSSAKIEVEAKWLVCREVCIPEHADLQLSLPVARAASQSGAAALFLKTEKLLPQPLPRGWRITARSEKDAFVLTMNAGRSIKRAEFFPLDPDQIDNPAAQTLRPLPTGMRLTLKKSDQLLKPIPSLRGILSLPDGPAYRIEARMAQSLQ